MQRPCCRARIVEIHFTNRDTAPIVIVETCAITTATAGLQSSEHRDRTSAAVHEQPAQIIWQSQQAVAMCAMHHIDTMSLGVLSFLQTHQLVTGVEAKEQAGATTLQISLWEQV
jgi:hypothetical protein